MTPVLPNAELRDLVFRYALAVDRRDAVLLASLFTEDGVLGGYREKEPRYAGREGWTQMIDEVSASFGPTMHNIYNQTVERDDVGGFYGLVTGSADHLMGENREELLHFAMLYHDRYARVGSRWKFRERRLEVMWVETRAVRQFSPEMMGRELNGFTPASRA